MTVLARFVLAAFVVALAATAFAEEEGAKRPNIVVILADDLGWNDVGYHGSEIRTPNLDRLASEGVELDRFYVQPSCSPTRSSLMTGKSSRRLGIHRPLGKNEGDGLGLDERILPQYLGALGYQPVMVGKWHLGHYVPDYFPQSRGFEHFYGYLTGGIGYWDHNHGGGHDWQRNGETLREEGYSTHLLADEAVRLLPRMLLDIQNRGQLSAGLTSYNPQRNQLIDTHKDVGSVSEVFRLSHRDSEQLMQLEMMFTDSE